jgi:hypothetical protein
VGNPIPNRAAYISLSSTNQSGRHAMAQTSQPIPTSLLYPLLKALGPERMANARFKAPKGERLSVSAKRAFQATLAAAQQAKSPQQFAKTLGGEASNQAALSHGSITTLTVSYGKDGYTKVEIIFQDGTHILSIFPTT